MIRTPLLTAAAALTLAAAANAQPSASPGPDAMTRDFITKAAQSDEFERLEGRLAEVRAQNPRVRTFAAQMVRDHTRTTQDLKQAIRRTGLPPPPPPSVDADEARMMANLRVARGPTFDKLYITQQVQAHQQALALMRTYARNGPPGPIRDAAGQTVPLIEHHLDMATGIERHSVSEAGEPPPFNPPRGAGR